MLCIINLTKQWGIHVQNFVRKKSPILTWREKHGKCCEVRTLAYKILYHRAYLWLSTGGIEFWRWILVRARLKIMLASKFGISPVRLNVYILDINELFHFFRAPFNSSTVDLCDFMWWVCSTHQIKLPAHSSHKIAKCKLASLPNPDLKYACGHWKCDSYITQWVNAHTKQWKDENYK